MCRSERTPRLLSMKITAIVMSSPAPTIAGSTPAAPAIGPIAISPIGIATKEPTMSYE